MFCTVKMNVSSDNSQLSSIQNGLTIFFSFIRTKNNSLLEKKHLKI